MQAGKPMSTLERLFNEGSYWCGLRGTGRGCDGVELGITKRYTPARCVQKWMVGRTLDITP